MTMIKSLQVDQKYKMQMDYKIPKVIKTRFFQLYLVLKRIKFNIQTISKAYKVMPHSLWNNYVSLKQPAEFAFKSSCLKV